MSFILDALRKSDARRQQTGAPGLNSPEPPRRPRRRSRLWSLLATVLVLAAVAATAVYVVRPDWAPRALVGAPETTAEQPPTTLSDSDPDRAQPDGGAKDPSSAEELLNRRQVAEEREQRRTPSPPSDPEKSGTRRQAQQVNDSDEAPRDRRAPIPASPERTIRREAPERESAPIPADQATKELERRMAQQARDRRQPSRQPSEPPESRRQPARDQSRQSPEAQSNAESAPLNEGVAEYVRAWELPLSVRQNLPELDLTIHVFSPVETERFVLINGERYVSGDEIGEAQIVGISREGAIVDFRSHRFLLEPK